MWEDVQQTGRTQRTYLSTFCGPSRDDSTWCRRNDRMLTHSSFAPCFSLLSILARFPAMAFLQTDDPEHAHVRIKHVAFETRRPGRQIDRLPMSPVFTARGASPFMDSSDFGLFSSSDIYDQRVEQSVAGRMSRPSLPRSRILPQSQIRSMPSAQTTAQGNLRLPCSMRMVLMVVMMHLAPTPMIPMEQPLAVCTVHR